ncbi:metal-dependent hydrolase family protein [Actinokineospora spheciospongiae]|uniref:metal-dependent hydrolase family protein n=1 Tax=Actinokineospora spheciospongiae TaxID=909613 RepID=UPI000D718F7F|nr:amidohydrolase family protein [Actinokineospora spheciospongiae]PWW62471.1 imidazolonepropionase-like amidohydrolase [Actinokineospora spheciospongiae]
MSMLLTGATLIDGLGGDPTANSAVVVTDDRITAVGSTADAPADADLVDLSGLTLLPGLIDAHVHMGHASEMRAVLNNELSVAERAADIFRTLRQTVEAGFTAVRDCGGIDHGILRTVGKGMVPGPRLWASASPLVQCGGHGHLGSPFQAPDESFAFRVRGLTAVGRISDGRDEVRKAARECFRQGATFLKMAVTGGVVSIADDLDDTQFSIEEIAVAVEEANARHTYVTVHAHNKYGIQNAVKAGVKCVEHGTGIDEATAAQMAAAGVALVPTLAIAQVLTDDFDAHGLPPQIRERVCGTMEGMVEAIRLATAAGIPVGSGSDLIGPKQDRRGLELALKAKVLGPMGAIQSTTSVNAEIMRVADKIGSVEVGKFADVIAVDFDPLTEPELFDDPSRVRLVVKGGKVVKDTRK